MWRRQHRLLFSTFGFGLIWQAVADKCSLPTLYPDSSSANVARQTPPMLDGLVERLVVTGIDMNIPSGSLPDTVPVLVVPGLELKISCLGTNPTLSLENGELVANIPLGPENHTEEIGCEFVIPTTLTTVKFDVDPFFRPAYLATIEAGFINLKKVNFDWTLDQVALSVSSSNVTLRMPTGGDSLIVEKGGQARSSGGGGFFSTSSLAVRGRIYGGKVSSVDVLYLQGPILSRISGSGTATVKVYSSFGCSEVMLERCEPIGVDISLPPEHPCTVPYCASQCTTDEFGTGCEGGFDDKVCESLSEGWQHDPVGGQEIAPSGYEDDCSTTEFISYDMTWSNVETIVVDYNFPKNSGFTSFGLAALTIRPVVGSEETKVSTTPSNAIDVELQQENGTLILSPGDLKGRTPDTVGILVEVPAEQLRRVRMGLSDWTVRLESGFTNFRRIVSKFSGTLFLELSSEAAVVLEDDFSSTTITVEGGALVSHEIADNLAIKGNIISGTASSFLDQIYVEGEITGSFEVETKLSISTNCANVDIGQFGEGECSVLDTLEVSLPRPFCTLPYCDSLCESDEFDGLCESFDCFEQEWYHNLALTVAPTTTTMPAFAEPMTPGTTPGPSSSPSVSPVSQPPVTAPVESTTPPSMVSPSTETPAELPTVSPVASGVSKRGSLSVSSVAFVCMFVLVFIV